MSLLVLLSDVQTVTLPAVRNEGYVPQEEFVTMEWVSGLRQMRPYAFDISGFFRSEDTDETYVYLLPRQQGPLAIRPPALMLKSDKVWWASDINELYFWED